MKTFMQSLRESGILVLSILVVLVSFGVYYYVYVENQRSYLTSRNLRQLNAVAKKTESTIGAMVLASKNQASREGAETQTGFFDPLPEALQADTGTGISLEAPDNEIWLLNPVRKPGRGGAARVYGKRIDIRSLTNTEALQAVFDIVLVIDGAGSILYQPANSLRDLTVRAFDTLLTASGAPVSPSKSGLATAVSTLDVAGSRYEIFSQPLQLPETVRLAHGPWIMVGLTTVDHFRKESMRASYDVLIGFVFLIFFVGLSWPLLKLVFIGPNEELRPAEVSFLVVTSLVGSALITILIVNFFCFRTSLVSDMDRHLGSFARTIEGNLHGELTAAVKQLRALDAALPDSPVAREDTVPNILADPRKPYFPQSYPYLEMMYIVDARGKQWEKWSVREQPTPMINVFERPYFQNVESGRLWSVALDDGKRAGFCLEPHLSWTTGAFEIALAIPSQAASRKNWVVAMNTGPWSLFQATVMRGFGYAVIDVAGNVLFHSDTSRNLSENLFDECDNDRDLIAAVHARSAGSVVVNYGGVTHTMYVMPARDLPWHVVAFRNEDIVKSADAEVISVSMVMFIVYAAVLLALFAAFFLRQGWHVEWAWPVASHRYLYIRVLCLYLFLSIVLLLLRGFDAPAGHLLIATVLLPLTGIVLTFIELKPDLLIVRWYQGKRRAFNRTVAATLILLLVLSAADFAVWFPWFLCAVILVGGFVFLKSRWAARQVSQAWLPILMFAAFGYVVSTVIPMGLLPGAGAAVLAAALTVVALVGWGLWSGTRRWRGIPAPGYRTAYAAAGMAFLFLAAVQPALNFFRIAFDEQMILFVKYEQLHLAGDLEKRADRIRLRYATIRSDESQFSKRMRDSIDIYAGFFFATNPFASPDGEAGCAESGGEESVIPHLMPEYDTLSTQMRSLGGCASADALWHWSFSRETRSLTLARNSLMLRQGAADSVMVSSVVPGYVRQLDSLAPLRWLALLLTLGVMLVTLYALVRFFMKKVFLVDADPPSCPESPARAGLPLAGNLLVVGPVTAGLRETLASDTRFRVIDLMKAGKPDEWRRKIPALPGVSIVVDHLEYLSGDPNRTLEKMAFIDELVSPRQRRVILISAADPRAFTSPPGPDRWESLLVSFTRTRYFPAAAGTIFSRTVDRKTPPSFGVFLKKECGADPYLQHVVLEMFGGATGGREDDADAGCLADEFAVAARVYYSALWSACSRDERRVLISLSRNGYASPASVDTVRQLMRNGLVRRGPALRLMNDTFRDFVLDVQRPEDWASLESETRTSVWQKLRAPIMLSLVGALLFLFVTQREALNSTAAFITAAAGLLPALLRLLGVLQGGGGSQAPGDS